MTFSMDETKTELRELNCSENVGKLWNPFLFILWWKQALCGVVICTDFKIMTNGKRVKMFSYIPTIMCRDK